MSHDWKMLAACVGPLLLLFVLPLLGIGDGTTLFVFVALMFVAHLLMMRRHGATQDDEEGPKGKGER